MNQNSQISNRFLLISIIAVTITTFGTTSQALGLNYDDNDKGQLFSRSRFIRSLDSILKGLASLDQSSSSHREVSRPQGPGGYGKGGLNVNSKPSRLGSVSSQYEMSDRDHHGFVNQRVRSEPDENKAQGQRRLDINFPMIPFPPELPPLSLFGIGGLPGFEEEEGKSSKGSKISSSKHSGYSSYNKGSKGVKEKGRDYDDEAYDTGNEYPGSKYSPYKTEGSRGDKNKKDEDDEGHSPRKEVASSPAPFYPSHGPSPQELRLPMFSYRRGQGYPESTYRLSSGRNLPSKGKHDSINSVLNEEFEEGTGVHFRGYHRLPAEGGGSSRQGHSEQGVGEEGYSIQGELADPSLEKNHKVGDGYPSHGGHGLVNTHNLRVYEGHGARGSGDGHSSYGGHSARHGQSSYGSQALGQGHSTQGNYGVGNHFPTYGVHGSGQGQTGSYQSHGYGHGQPSYGGSGLSHGGGYGLSYGGHQLSYPGLTSHHSVIPTYPSGDYGTVDYKGHQTAVNAAALQAIKSITSLDHDASFSYPGVGGSGSAYNGISGFAGLYR